MSNSTNGRAVKSTRTTFRIIEVLEARDGAGLTDLAAELGLAKSTVHQQLSALYDLGYVVKEGNRYQLGLKFLTLGEHVRTRKKVYTLAEPLVEELASKTGERAQFFAQEHGRAIYVHTKQGAHAVQAGRRVGKQRYLHSSAGGKAILAHLPEADIEAVIDRWGLPAETDNTHTTREALFEDLAAIRERGYSLNRAESISGLWSVGVPVMGPDERPVGAFSISGPRHRMKGESVHEEMVDLLLGTANELELNIAYS
jgi:DNA-binding IclR family transcriptional regulator